MARDGAIAVIAKCPMAGKSKTRLIPLLGEQGSAALARAMLSDVLTSLSRCEELKPAKKILFYAPPTQQGLEIMREILISLSLYSQPHQEWVLLPMVSVSLASSDLGDQLTDALVRARQVQVEEHHTANALPGPVIFLGMDAPELPLGELVSAFEHPDTALLCPSDDGGYGMLSVPATADADSIFDGIRWSDPLTAVAQLKNLTDGGVPVRIGQLMHDMDEPDDVLNLCARLRIHHLQDSSLLPSLPNNAKANAAPSVDSKYVSKPDILMQPSSLLQKREICLGRSMECSCHYTKQILVKCAVMVVC